MERVVKNFWTEDRGNATLDWLVLTAGVVLLVVALIASVGVGSAQAADGTAPALSLFDLQTRV